MSPLLILSVPRPSAWLDPPSQGAEWTESESGLTPTARWPRPGSPQPLPGGPASQHAVHPVCTEGAVGTKRPQTSLWVPRWVGMGGTAPALGPWAGCALDTPGSAPTGAPLAGSGHLVASVSPWVTPASQASMSAAPVAPPEPRLIFPSHRAQTPRFSFLPSRAGVRPAPSLGSWDTGEGSRCSEPPCPPHRTWARPGAMFWSVSTPCVVRAGPTRPLAGTSVPRSLGLGADVRGFWGRAVSALSSVILEESPRVFFESPRSILWRAL